MPPRDSTAGTVLIALILCVVCSAVVSTAAVGLKGWQEENKALDKKKNVLLAAGFAEDIKTSSVDDVFAERIEKEFIEISTGEVLNDEQLTSLGIDPETYDPKKAAGDKKLKVEIKDGALPGLSHREPVAEIYKIVDGDSITGYVLPIYGKGLWSTCYGFIALKADKETVRGITYYKDGETPGLGGEINNPNWQAQWPDKKVYGEDGKDGEVDLTVVKGKASDEYEIDGLSGATITSKGVDQMIKYWLGPNAFGKYLAAN